MTAESAAVGGRIADSTRGGAAAIRVGIAAAGVVVETGRAVAGGEAIRRLRVGTLDANVVRLVTEVGRVAVSVSQTFHTHEAVINSAVA
jgi:hypothetical protein